LIFGTTWRRHHEEESWRRNHEEESWRRNHGGGIMEEELRRRNLRGIMEEESWRRYPGGGTMRNDGTQAPRRHPGGTQEARDILETECVFSYAPAHKSDGATTFA